MVGKEGKRIPVIPIVFGLLFLLIVVIAVVLVVGMNREYDDAAGRQDGPRWAARTKGRAAGTSAREKGGPGASEDGTAEDGTAPTAEETVLTPTGYTIAGQVVDEAGQGVAEAEVLICFDAWSRKTERIPVAKRLKTDADGHFRAQDLPKKRLLITATSKDHCYYMPRLPLSDRARCWYPVTYLPGRDLVEYVRLVLRPGAVIAGRVVDTEGDPITDAVVTMKYVRGAAPELPVDHEGRFRAGDLAPGRYNLSVKADGFMESHLSPSVRAGTEDLVICLRRASTIEGTVIFADTGEPAPGAKVESRIVMSRALRASLGGIPMGPTVETDHDGRFKVPVCPGMDTEFLASWEEYYSKGKSTVHVEAEGPTEPVTIELIKGAVVSGTVVDDETDVPLPGVRVSAFSITRLRRVRTESDAEGHFTLAGLAEGKNRIYASSEEYDLANPTPRDTHLAVEVTEGKDLSGIELRLVKKPVIAGKVVDEEGEPVFCATVVGKEKENESGGQRMYPGGSGFSEADGTFVMRRSRLDRTIMGLLVTHPQYANTYFSFEPDGVTSETKDVVIVLKKTGGSIEGSVRREQGEPLAQVVVLLLDATMTGSSSSRVMKLKSTVTDEAGHYVLSAVGDGTYRIKASLGEQEVVSSKVPIVEGKTVTGIDLTLPALPALGHIAGRVTDDKDRPLAGLQMSIVKLPRVGKWSSMTTDSDGRYRFDGLLEGEEYELSFHHKPGLVRVGPHRPKVRCSADDVDFTFKVFELGTVSGFVYQESDGSPVTKFDLSVNGKESGAYSNGTFNSEDGSFSLPEVAVGLSVITVGIENVHKHTSEPFEVVAGKETVQVIYLPEMGTVRGFVGRQADGSPVTKFRLSLIQDHGHYWRAENRYEGKEYESDEGAFLCKDVKPGRYMIGIVAEGLPDFKSEAFEVTAGIETVQEILIGEGGIIRGVVVDESGLPVQDAVVEVAWHESGLRGQMRASLTGIGTPERPRDTTGKAGEFELTNVTPGKMTLRVTHAGYAPLDVRDIAVSEDAPVEDLEIKLERGAVVFGWVKDSQGELRGDVEVRLTGGRSKHTQTDYRGQYRFEHVPGGTHQLTVSYLGASLPNFEVKSGEDKEINIDFAEAGTISGTIHAPAEGEEVWFRLDLEGRDKAAGARRRVELHDKNAFKFEGVFPGKYTLRLRTYWENGEDRRSPTVTIDPREIVIEISAKERVTQDITITKIEERK